MKEERILKVIKAPIVSEKASRLADKNRQFVFEVACCAQKREVKLAIEHLFKVEVENVAIINVKGKVKGRGPIKGRQNDWKKAIVSLKEGHDINYAVTENAGK